MVVGLLGGAAYGAMFALANFVQPKQREMTITIPQQRLPSRTDSVLPGRRAR